MSEFLASQLDFIVFFNGLSWVLCGMIALSLAHTARLQSWTVLGAFGIFRGISTWLDLAVVTIGDSLAFSAVRAVTLAVSFLLLLEFARREGRAYGLRVPGPWIHALGIAIAAAGWFAGGADLAVIFIRYGIAVPATIGSGVALLQRVRGFESRQYWIIVASVSASALYAFACGLVVPQADFFPASVINESGFFAATGVPIDLVRSVAACLQATALAGIWFNKTGLQSGSDAYRRFLGRLFLQMLTAMIVALVGGWSLTQYMGKIYRADIEFEARGDMTVLTARLTVQSDEMSSLVRLLARDHDVIDVFADPADPSLLAEARHEVMIAVDEARARHGMIFDAKGRTIAADMAPLGESDAELFAASPAFRRALLGGEALWLYHDPVTNLTALFAAAAARSEDGTPLGVVALQTTLSAFAADLEHFQHPYFLLDPDGVVVVSNRPDFAFRPLWPIAANRLPTVFANYAQLDNRPILPAAVTDGVWAALGDDPALFRRAPAGSDGWSIIMAVPPTGRFASRVLGIVITLLGALAAIAYLLGRDRQVYDAISLEQKLHLQLVARDLESKAHTDALTGLGNRLLFDRALAAEIDRAERYGTPASLLLLDADHFKRINDSYGHPVGDAVLKRIAAIARARVRNSDILVRWGGEEFALLMPQADLASARAVAEKLRLAIEEATFEAVGRVTCSMGVAELRPGDTAQSLVSRADAALYNAKANGRNRVECSQPQAAAA
jgi:diguanylate cyclase (GGDEF)-like protein